MSGVEVVVPVTLFLVTGWVIWSFIKGRQAKFAIQAQMQIQQKMLERFGSSSELVEFIRTPEGGRYLEQFTESPVSSPMERTLSSVRTGIIVAFISAGLITVGALLGDSFNENGPMVFGLLGGFLGAGFLIAAYASHQLAKRWGLVEKGAPDQQHV